MGQTFLSAIWGDFPVAPRLDWNVRLTGGLESLPGPARPLAWLWRLDIFQQVRRHGCRCFILKAL